MTNSKVHSNVESGAIRNNLQADENRFSTKLMTIIEIIIISDKIIVKYIFNVEKE